MTYRKFDVFYVLVAGYLKSIKQILVKRKIYTLFEFDALGM